MQSKSKFTLIELLVVIAIITILAAMLLPALNKAREKAYASNCISAKKQLGQIFLLYGNDFNDQMPIHKLGADPWGWYLRELYTYQYLKSAGPALADKLLVCQTAAQLALAVQSIPLINSYTYGTVGYNGYLVNGNDFTKSLKLTTLSKPSSCAMLGENYAGSNFMIDGVICFPHNNSFSVAFYDAHVSMISQKEAPASAADRTLTFWVGK